MLCASLTLTFSKYPMSYSWYHSPFVHYSVQSILHNKPTKYTVFYICDFVNVESFRLKLFLSEKFVLLLGQCRNILLQHWVMAHWCVLCNCRGLRRISAERWSFHAVWGGGSQTHPPFLLPLYIKQEWGVTAVRIGCHSCQRKMV